MNNLKNIEIWPNAFNMTVYASQGDIGSIIAMHKIVELRNLIAFANYAIYQACGKQNLTDKYILLRSAILDYNSCNDYILQIIYFGFDFCLFIDSNEEYIRQMDQECRKKIRKKVSENEELLVNSRFYEKIEDLKKQSVSANNFFKKYKKFGTEIRKSDVKIDEWANTIKHRGGFVVDELLDKKTLARVISKTYNGDKLFDSAYVFSPTTFDEIFKRLEKQNSLIIDFVNYLQLSIFGDINNLDSSISQKLFSAKSYDKRKGNAYLKSFEDNQ